MVVSDEAKSDPSPHSGRGAGETAASWTLGTCELMPRTPHLWTATCRGWTPSRTNELNALRADAEPIVGFVLHDGRLERGDAPPAPTYPTAQAESDLLSKIGKASGLAATLPAVEVTTTKLTPLDGKMRMGGLPFDTQLHFPARIDVHRGDIIRISQPPDSETPGYEIVHVVAVETCVRQRKCQRGVVVRGWGGTVIRPFPDRAACSIVGHVIVGTAT